MTLLRQIQSLLERTYAPTGINLEEYVIGVRRHLELERLAGKTAAHLSEEGRVYLRHHGHHLRLALYYSPEIIELLETYHPSRGLDDRNIRALIIFIEEINHALHAALQFHEGQAALNSEHFSRNLELQARIDTYFVLTFFCVAQRQPRRLAAGERAWLRHWLFEREVFEYANRRLQERYQEVNRLGRRFVDYLEGLPPDSRVDEIRRWRPLAYRTKRQFILRHAA